MYDDHHYYSSHRLHIKIIRHLFVPPKNRHPFMSLEKKRKTYKITDLNAKIRKGWVSRVPSHFLQRMLHKIVLRYLTLFICLICFTRWGEIVIHCFDGWCLYALIYRHEAWKKKHLRNALFLSNTKSNRLSNIFSQLFFLPFSFHAFNLFFLICFQFFFSFLQFRQHYFLTVLAVYTVDGGILKVKYISCEVSHRFFKNKK